MIFIIPLIDPKPDPPPPVPLLLDVVFELPPVLKLRLKLKVAFCPLQIYVRVFVLTEDIIIRPIPISKNKTHITKSMRPYHTE